MIKMINCQIDVGNNVIRYNMSNGSILEGTHPNIRFKGDVIVDLNSDIPKLSTSSIDDIECDLGILKHNYITSLTIDSSTPDITHIEGTSSELYSYMEVTFKDGRTENINYDLYHKFKKEFKVSPKDLTFDEFYKRAVIIELGESQYGNM